MDDRLPQSRLVKIGALEPSAAAAVHGLSRTGQGRRSKAWEK
ncbi:MAG: hypothetical protein R6V12_15530 [Candidatus Hydrogenedentota bacterium]